MLAQVTMLWKIVAVITFTANGEVITRSYPHPLDFQTEFACVDYSKTGDFEMAWAWLQMELREKFGSTTQAVWSCQLERPEDEG